MTTTNNGDVDDVLVDFVLVFNDDGIRAGNTRANDS